MYDNVLKCLVAATAILSICISTPFDDANGVDIYLNRTCDENNIDSLHVFVVGGEQNPTDRGNG